MHELYEITKQQWVPGKTDCEYKQVEVIKIPTETAGKLNSLYWKVITLGKARAYVIKDTEGKIIHSSYVIPKCYKFPFLRSGFHDIEIGPCVTNPKYRGKGLYPYVLSEIISRELNDSDRAYMIVDSENHASIRGVMKAGFTKTAEIRKDGLKRYAVSKRMDVL